MRRPTAKTSSGLDGEAGEIEDVVQPGELSTRQQVEDVGDALRLVGG